MSIFETVVRVVLVVVGIPVVVVLASAGIAHFQADIKREDQR